MLQLVHHQLSICTYIHENSRTLFLEISTKPFQLVTGRTWKGSAFGGWKGRDDIPKLVDEFMEEELEIDAFITGQLPLDQINEAFTLMREGKR